MARTSPTPTAGTLSERPSVSRSLLAKKARERLQREVSGEPIEAVFPDNLAPAEVAASSPETHGAEALASGSLVEATGALSECQMDNGAAQRNLVRDEALSSPQARSTPASTTAAPQIARDTRPLTVGDIKPNAGTVFAIIAGIVQERGQLTRPELVAAMASTSFPQAKARPQSKPWCQGYIAGAIRSGIIAQVERANAEVSAPLPSTGEA